MPRQIVKPLIKLTPEQWKEVVKRVFQKSTKLTKEAAEELMQYEPPVTREMGTLMKDIPVGGGEFIRTYERLPIEEARAKYFASPEEYVAPRVAEPPARELAFLPPEEGVQLGPEELARRLAYERLVFKPILPPRVESAVKTVEKEVTTPVISEQVTTAPTLKEALNIADAAAQLWKAIGGERSQAGRLWKHFYEGARGAVKAHYASPRDYFIASFYRWIQNPKKFARGFPREARVFEQLRDDPDLADIILKAESGGK